MNGNRALRRSCAAAFAAFALAATNGPAAQKAAAPGPKPLTHLLDAPLPFAYDPGRQMPK